MLRFLIVFCICCVYVIGHEKLQNGDLLFVRASDSRVDGAIGAATHIQTKPNYTHVGIVEVDEGGIYVIEANMQQGVVRIPFMNFQESNPSFDAYRLVGKYDVKDILARAKTYLGQPYDFYYRANNGKMYCSELVWESYLDKKGAHIFEAKPMNFYDSQGKLPSYWRESFEKLGVAVPQGELGTNPNTMSQSKQLIKLRK